MSLCERFLQLINEEASKMGKLVQGGFEDRSTHRREEDGRRASLPQQINQSVKGHSRTWTKPLVFLIVFLFFQLSRAKGF